jgi:chromosome partitioning protein
MSATIITIAQHKGGAGKTTLTTQLAVAVSHDHHKVLVIDSDPQGSTSEWHRERVKTLGRKNKIGVMATQGWKLIRDLPNLIDEYDYILIDTPPHAESEASIAVRLSHLVLMPVQPSPLDVWACAPTIKLILDEKKPVMLVMNRVPAKSKLNETMMEKLATLKINVAKQSLGNRTIFAGSMIKGLGVIEHEPRSIASEEIQILWKDIQKYLKKLLLNRL